MEKDPTVIQKDYYTATADKYDTMHLGDDEHRVALSILLGFIDYLDATSVLDIGSGTGRVLSYLQERNPALRVIGIEPVQTLREAGYKKGIDPNELIDGDGTAINFPDDSFDIVCEFGVLHHIAQPELAVGEMLRVARKAIFISDSNRFGQGSLLHRSIKQLLATLGLWPLANYIKTRGKKYIITEGDGLSYSYSVFDNYNQIKKHCKTIHLINTRVAGVSIYRSSGHVALIGRK